MTYPSADMTVIPANRPARSAKPPTTIRAFCLNILECGDLETKLTAPTDADGQPLPDTDRAPSNPIDRPARSDGLRMAKGGERLPRPGQLKDPALRILVLSRFAHHELMAVELFAWALLRWPNIPDSLRRGILSALVDEQKHCRLYLARLEAHGGRFDTDGHSDYFWQQIPVIANSDAGPRAFLAAIGLTLEQANLDFTLTYRDAFVSAGDPESAQVCQIVHDEEIAHVALAARWIQRLDDSDADGVSKSDLDAYLDAVPYPLGPSRAKGRRFEVAPRRRAGLSEELIEFIRVSRSSPERGFGAADRIELWPNLAAEEGDDWRASQTQPHVRAASRLWSLLYSPDAQLMRPSTPSKSAKQPTDPSRETRVQDIWPPALGPAPKEPVFNWLAHRGQSSAWLNTETLEQAHLDPAAVKLSGPSAAHTRFVHDKAFAITTAHDLGLLSRALEPLIHVIDPEAFESPDTLVSFLDKTLSDWPKWTQQRFTLKPRFGTSGRGRVAGLGSADSPAIRGAFPRLAQCGGAILEPWLTRRADLSVAMLIPKPNQQDECVTLLGSLEMLATASGAYRGHCGEFDSRGRVFSGHPEDETLRGDCAAVAEKARGTGFFGPCGIDGFIYREDGRERLRSLVEFNARMTMGLVTIGVVRRALPEIRERLELTPGDRCGLLLAFIEPDPEFSIPAMTEAAGSGAFYVHVGAPGFEAEPRPVLFFSRERESLRKAYLEIFGC